MESRLELPISPQPDDFTCGPTCLQAVYGYYGDPLPLRRVIREVSPLEGGGTLAVLLGCHALGRGYRAAIYTYNLHIFDPTWFANQKLDLRSRLEEQRRVKRSRKLRAETDAYLEFLDQGGIMRYEDLTPALIRRFLSRSIPILTGLSATYLYRSAREHGPESTPDDINGEPVGHFVVLSGYDPEEREVLVADPLLPNPVSKTHIYRVGIDRLIGSILLGIVTSDANLLVIEPPRKRKP
ncbi:MAG TPA: peptidase-C39 like family protein [Thermoanaerobaculia bacterium]|nr:peptidase-C39 like family protein [Thermoanaerobaculia bacterium]